MATPRVLILRSPGANCDAETQFAFEQAGGQPERIHIQRVRENPALLRDFQILCIPGGFSYGDDVAAGKILAHQLSHFLADELRTFRDHEKLILGICNGFQVLLKAGLIVQPDEEGPLATLTYNDRGYQDRWLTLKVASQLSPFFRDMGVIRLPMAHGEGKFVSRKPWISEGLRQSGQIVLEYTRPDGSPANGEYPHNPNGSQCDIAAVCDASGRVMGMMPHPERHMLGVQHPQWTRLGLKEEGDGMALFRNAVAFFNED